MSRQRRKGGARRRFFDAVIQGADVGSALHCGRLLTRQGMTVLVCEQDLSLAPGPCADPVGGKET